MCVEAKLFGAADTVLLTRRSTAQYLDTFRAKGRNSEFQRIFYVFISYIFYVCTVYAYPAWAESYEDHGIFLEAQSLHAPPQQLVHRRDTLLFLDNKRMLSCKGNTNPITIPSIVPIVTIIQ